ncbi:glutaredoxin family protein [Cellulomonas bogoriensis]|uniref:Glutaredoxin n=1 Tax=Cellulomonas bogoriensis 69B4 = DSM 16987 TaxID=1386082 RepID=A0A0A0BYB6_9CELL|nr:glutaredoxin family protein [Cellulomonas bogoriensis]KGM13383.1 glutaredoxin [Cellulomonas bogoriensis 69B4 = DSM 16987]
MPNGAVGAERLVLYVRTGCHLCAQARQVIAQVAAEAGVGWGEVDIDEHPDREQLTRMYGELVPVVTVDGVQQGYWRLDAGRLRRALAQGPR